MTPRVEAPGLMLASLARDERTWIPLGPERRDTTDDALENAMNKGDFVGACLPGDLLRAGTDRYVVLSQAEAIAGTAGMASVGFTIPAALMTQLQAEGLVKADRILLYDNTMSPTASPQYMQRYLDVLRQLGPVMVTD